MMSNNSFNADLDSNLNYILLFRLIVWGYFGMVLSLFGIIGNIITMLVLISPSMRTTSTNIYLTALSCSNILFLLMFIPSYSIRYLLDYRLYMTNQPPSAFEILLIRLPTTPVYNTILLSMIYITIAVSMDRLILVKFPLKAKRMLTQCTTLITILLIYIFCIVYCMLYWLEQRYIPELKQCRLTNIANKKNRTDYHITLMLITMIIAFVICQLPLLILNVWYAIDPHGAYYNHLFHKLNSIGILLIVCNTSTNFLLYCFFGQKFRQTLIEFILQILPKQYKQTNIQKRSSKLIQLERKQSLESIYEQKQRILSKNSVSITNSLNHNNIKSNELNQQIVNDKSNQNSLQTCCEQRFPRKRCAKCNSAITSAGITFTGASYHAACFLCMYSQNNIL
ncbi:unnamed protein product [Rotaria sordida]|uniref:G-protein coupled receptors family 1 profile domain-containing protein n=1 Tax=Rotaria sordida TaxID=392033 RepID=A0A814Q714_9BILA|nr:unnamed protein product [Rotaria sordida]CAF1115269.1 unnamed protein product [Rotaria sordida]CAF1516395.1 unnamed protein product [Rotaria sordida]CAF4029696.1 unnamed protein product [Rotaria sordida]